MRNDLLICIFSLALMKYSNRFNKGNDSKIYSLKSIFVIIDRAKEVRTIIEDFYSFIYNWKCIFS